MTEGAALIISTHSMEHPLIMEQLMLIGCFDAGCFDAGNMWRCHRCLSVTGPSYVSYVKPDSGPRLEPSLFQPQVHICGPDAREGAWRPRKALARSEKAQRDYYVEVVDQLYRRDIEQKIEETCP